MEPSCTVSENVGATVKNNSVDPKKLKMELPYNPVIPLLGIHAKLFHDSTPLPHPSVNEQTILRRRGKNTQKNYTKEVLMPQRSIMV